MDQTIQNQDSSSTSQSSSGQTQSSQGSWGYGQQQQQLLQELKKDFNGTIQSTLTDGELANEMAKKPVNPLEAILEAEQKKELRLNDARKTLNINGKSKEEILSRYPENPFERSN